MGIRELASKADHRCEQPKTEEHQPSIRTFGGFWLAFLQAFRPPHREDQLIEALAALKRPQHGGRFYENMGTML